MPRSGMQYVQRRLQRSVTEIRRSSCTRPKVSTSGPDRGISRIHPVGTAPPDDGVGPRDDSTTGTVVTRAPPPGPGPGRPRGGPAR